MGPDRGWLVNVEERERVSQSMRAQRASARAEKVDQNEMRLLRAVVEAVKLVLPHAKRNGLSVARLETTLADLARGESPDRLPEVDTLRLRFAEIIRVTDTDATHAAKSGQCAIIARAALNGEPITHPTGRR